MRLRHEHKEKDSTVSITATEAKAQSEAALAEAKERWPAVKQVAASLRGSRHENNFSNRILLSMEEKRT